MSGRTRSPYRLREGSGVGQYKLTHAPTPGPSRRREGRI